jgi:hypothetical protein
MDGFRLVSNSFDLVLAACEEKARQPERGNGACELRKYEARSVLRSDASERVRQRSSDSDCGVRE